MLDALARVMKQGAELRLASDDAAYVEWTLERLMAQIVREGFAKPALLTTYRLVATPD